MSVDQRYIDAAEKVVEDVSPDERNSATGRDWWIFQNQCYPSYVEACKARAAEVARVAAILTEALPDRWDEACETCAAIADTAGYVCNEWRPPCNDPDHDDRWCQHCESMEMGSEWTADRIAAACFALKGRDAKGGETQ